MIILKITVQNLPELIAQGVDEVKVYRDTSSDGLFASSIGTINLVFGTESYEYLDTTGNSTHWYKFSYYNSGTSSESPKGEAYKGVTDKGPLGVVSVPYIKSTTDFDEILNLDDSRVAELIVRAEGYLQRYIGIYGGTTDSSSDLYKQFMPIAVRLMVEQIWLYNRPEQRKARSSVMMSEKIGNYSYSKVGGKQRDSEKLYMTDELTDILNGLIGNITNLPFSMTTTQVFPELIPDPNNPLTPQTKTTRIRGWMDFTDNEVSQGYTGYIDALLSATNFGLLPIVPHG